MKDLIWCPVDIPKIPIIPKHTNGKRWNFWSMMRMTEKRETPYTLTGWAKEIKDEYPELIEWFNYFPIKSIRNVKLNIQVDSVDPHIDFTKPKLDYQLYENNKRNEPCGYRILLTGTRQNTLYVIHNNKKIYCNMPTETDVYVLGHTSTLHGVEYDKDRMTIFTHFEIDSEKHAALIKRSINKYKNYAIFS